MALAKTLSVTLNGVAAQLVEVEANIGAGLPGTHIVGLASAAVNQARDRIKIAAQNSKLTWPKTKIMVSLLPSDVPKTGSHFDAAIAVAILSATHPDARVRASLANTMVLGEIGFDGRLRAVPGILPAVLPWLAPHGLVYVEADHAITDDWLAQQGCNSLAVIRAGKAGQVHYQLLTSEPCPSSSTPEPSTR